MLQQQPVDEAIATAYFLEKDAVNGVIEVHKTFPSEMSAVLLSVVLLASPFRHGASDWKFSF